MPPKEPWIANPRTRAVVVAGFMIFLLAGSLALAALYAGSRQPQQAIKMARVDFPALWVQAPQQWQPVDASQLPPGAAAMAEPGPEQRRLLIAPLPTEGLTAPANAMHLAIQELLDPATIHALHGSGAKAWRGPTLYGLTYSGLSTHDLRKHYLAVLTRDGQRYWVVYLTGPLTASIRDLRSVNLEIASDRLLFDAILQSARPADSQPDANPSTGAQPHRPTHQGRPAALGQVSSFTGPILLETTLNRRGDPRGRLTA